MFANEILIVIQWWFTIFLIGTIFLPMASKIFSNFKDSGYIFSKVLGLGIFSYIIFVLGTFHILVFSQINLILILGLLAGVNLFFLKGKEIKMPSNIIFFEEFIFLAALSFWVYIRGTNPNIHGLEKFMDFGFINSILRSNYFPPKDMWFAPATINYYYFGHLTVAVLTKLSDIKSEITFNLSLATMFAFTFVGAFSIGLNLIWKTINEKRLRTASIVGGLATAIFVSFGGNLQTIYTFFQPYTGEIAVPFWQLPFSPYNFPNFYWYPNATRFIYHTIHEFPIYSFVVSDLHAHVLSLPFVLFIIALLLAIFFEQRLKVISFKLLVLSLSLAILYMTNTWDTATYFLLAAVVIFYIQWRKKSTLSAFPQLLIIALSTFILILPFSISFKPFTQGIGVICPPQFLASIDKLGPFIFEAGNCQRSPFWQLLILYGFFLFWIFTFLPFIRKGKLKNLTDADIFIVLLIIVSLLLIILPEFFYIKDIYTAHYRANTMFKFTYQAFIMLQISSAYIIFRLVSKIKETKVINLSGIVVFIIGVFLSFLVFSYPVFAINSYYNGAKKYLGLDGEKYLQTLYPDDALAINWLSQNIKGQPVILEAQGDSYTDYGRISANTGLPTVLGWTVHEWLWHGGYNVPAPRIADVGNLYQTSDIETAKELLKKYNVSYVCVGNLERQKYPNLSEEKFAVLGKIVFSSGATRIYKISY